MLTKEDKEQLTSPDPNFAYMMLGRLRSDCEGFINRGLRLWAGGKIKHIESMLFIYDGLKVKPVWLTRKQIKEFAIQMNVKIEGVKL